MIVIIKTHYVHGLPCKYLEELRVMYLYVPINGSNEIVGFLCVWLTHNYIGYRDGLGLF